MVNNGWNVNRRRRKGNDKNEKCEINKAKEEKKNNCADTLA